MSTMTQEQWNILLDEILTGKYHNTVLDLSGKEINDEDLPELLGYIKYRSHIKGLDLSRNQIGAKGAELLAGCSVDILNLRGNNVRAEGAKKLLVDGKFKVLNLAENNIHDIGLQDLVLANGSALVELNLSENFICDEGTKAIAQNFLALITLDLSSNGIITGNGVKYFSNHPALQHLILSNNHIGAYERHGGLEATGLLAENKILRYLDLSYNMISNTAADKFLSTNTQCKLKIDRKYSKMHLDSDLNNFDAKAEVGSGKALLLSYELCKFSQTQEHAPVEVQNNVGPISGVPGLKQQFKKRA